MKANISPNKQDKTIGAHLSKQGKAFKYIVGK